MYLVTNWHMVDDLMKVEHRQISEQYCQLRTPSHIYTIPVEGFDLYRSDTEAFEQWLNDNNIQPDPRLD